MATQNQTQEISLPEQYSARPLTLDDAEAVAGLLARVNQKKGYESNGGPDEIRIDWQEPNFNLEDSSLIIENEASEIVAYATFWDTSSMPVQPWCSWVLKDDLYGIGLEQYIVNWFENKAKRVIEKCPPEARIVIKTNALEGYEKRMSALSNAGFTHSRNFYRMTIEMDEAPPEAQFPEHIAIRGMRYPDELRALVIALEEGFKDHWGFVEEPIDEELKYWQHFTETDKLFDPELFFLAIDTRSDKIAGVAVCRIEQIGKPETAYIEDFAVLPDYRRQGLGLAMLLHVFNDFYKRGRKQVALHVDADSLTGATRIYEKAGMKAVETWMNYQKVIRDGVELSTTSVE